MCEFYVSFEFKLMLSNKPGLRVGWVYKGIDMEQDLLKEHKIYGSAGIDFDFLTL